MTHRSYTIEPQRLKAGKGYELCEPHQAARIIIMEITMVPPKSGSKRYRIQRKVAEFYGPGALQRAQEELGRLTRGTTERRRPKVFARSLTIDEYEAACRADPSQRASRYLRRPW